MKTLLSVNNYYYRRDGSEVVYFEHNRLFEKDGWNIVPFSMQHPQNKKSKWSSFFVEEIEFGSNYSFIEKLKRVPKVIYSIEAKKNIESLIKNTKPDICHCHSIYHHISPSILSILKKNNIPTVMTLHDLKIACPAYHMHNMDAICEDCKNDNLFKVISNRCIKNSIILSTLAFSEAKIHQWLQSYSRYVDTFVSPCKFYIEKLVEFGWDRNKFVHIPNMIDPELFQPKFGSGEGYILYFGRLSPEKGLKTLLQACAYANKLDVDGKKAKLKLVFAGDGPQRQELEKIVADKNIDAVFHGQLSPDELEHVVRNAKATVLPAEWYENAPMSVLESYAMGKPVIATDIGGIPELIIEGSTGSLFKSGSVSELANLLRFFSDLSETEISHYGRAARRYVELNYSSSLYTERVNQLYKELLTTRKNQ